MGVDLDRKTPDAEEQGARLNDAVVGLSLGLDGYVKILSRVGHSLSLAHSILIADVLSC